MQRHPLDHPLDQPLLSQSVLHVPELTPVGASNGIGTSARVLIVATDPVVRAAFARGLSRQTVGEASPEEAAEKAQRLSADVVLWDLGPAGVAAEALAQLSVPVVVMTSATGAASRLLAAGARGVLRRDASPDAISDALAVVRHGLSVVDPSLVAGGTLGGPRLRAEDRPTESLTPREVQVLELVATGMSNKQIASDLGISAHTVKFHVNAILGKLDVHTRTQAVVRGVQLGLMTV